MQSNGEGAGGYVNFLKGLTTKLGENNPVVYMNVAIRTGII